MVGGRGRGGDNRKWRVFEGDGEDPTGSPGCSSKNNHLLTPITDLKRETDGLLLPEGEGGRGRKGEEGQENNKGTAPLRGRSFGGTLTLASMARCWFCTMAVR